MDAFPQGSELAHVARPTMCLQKGSASPRTSRKRQTLRGVESAMKLAGRLEYHSATFFQRRDRDRHETFQPVGKSLDGMCLPLIAGIQVLLCWNITRNRSTRTLSLPSDACETADPPTARRIFRLLPKRFRSADLVKEDNNRHAPVQSSPGSTPRSGVSRPNSTSFHPVGATLAQLTVNNGAERGWIGVDIARGGFPCPLPAGARAT